MDNCVKFESAVEKPASEVFRHTTRLWMVLEGDLLRLYKDEKKESCTGCVEVTDVQVARKTEHKDGREFEIITPHRSYTFLTESRELAETWVKSIQRARNQNSSSIDHRFTSKMHQTRARVSTQSSVTEELEEISSQPHKSIFGITLKPTRASKSSVSSSETSPEPIISEKSVSMNYLLDSSVGRNSKETEVTAVPLKDKTNTSTLHTSFMSEVGPKSAKLPLKSHGNTAVDAIQALPCNKSRIVHEPTSPTRNTSVEVPLALLEERADTEPDIKPDKRNFVTDVEQTVVSGNKIEVGPDIKPDDRTFMTDLAHTTPLQNKIEVEPAIKPDEGNSMTDLEQTILSEKKIEVEPDMKPDERNSMTDLEQTILSEKKIEVEPDIKPDERNGTTDPEKTTLSENKSEVEPDIKADERKSMTSLEQKTFSENKIEIEPDIKANERNSKTDVEQINPSESKIEVQSDIKPGKRNSMTDREHFDNDVFEITEDVITRCNNTNNILLESVEDNYSRGNVDNSRNDFDNKVHSLGDGVITDVDISNVEMRKRRSNNEESANADLADKVDTSQVVMRKSSKSRSTLSGANSFSRGKEITDDSEKFRQISEIDDHFACESPVLIRKSLKSDSQKGDYESDASVQHLPEKNMDMIPTCKAEPKSQRLGSDPDENGDESLLVKEAFMSIFALNNDEESRLDSGFDHSFAGELQAFNKLKYFIQVNCKDGFDLLSHHVSVKRPVEALRDFLSTF